MTAREKLLSFLDGPQADEILNEHGHELADEIRAWADSDAINEILKLAPIDHQDVDTIVRGTARLMAALIDPLEFPDGGQ